MSSISPEGLRYGHLHNRTCSCMSTHTPPVPTAIARTASAQKAERPRGVCMHRCRTRWRATSSCCSWPHSCRHCRRRTKLTRTKSRAASHRCAQQAVRSAARQPHCQWPADSVIPADMSAASIRSWVSAFAGVGCGRAGGRKAEVAGRLRLAAHKGAGGCGPTVADIVAETLFAMRHKFIMKCRADLEQYQQEGSPQACS